MNSVNTQIWKGIWEELALNFSKGYFIEKLYSPHILIDDIIDEITHNGFQNVQNRLLFYKYLNQEMNDDPVIQNHLKHEFAILRKHFNKSGNAFILNCCQDIKSNFSNGFYFRKCVEMITGLITSEREIEKDEQLLLRKINLRLIAEFAKKDYHIDDIKLFAHNILDESHFHEGQIYTDFPHGLDYHAYLKEDGRLDLSRYNSDISNGILNLTTQERMQKLLYYFSIDRKPLYFIFNLEGFKGEVDITIGDATFYSANKRNFIKKEMTHQVFEGVLKKKMESKYINVAVKVDYILPHTSHTIAVQKLETLIDLFNCYLNLSMELTFDNSSYITVDESGAVLSITSGKAPVEEQLRFLRSIDLTQNKNFIETFLKYSFLLSGQDETIGKILNGLHWHRKGKFAQKDEDRLVYHWIAIENLLKLEEEITNSIVGPSGNKSTINIAQEIVGASSIRTALHETGWDLHRHYAFSPNRQFPPEKSMPSELIERAQLNTNIGKVISLEGFVKCLPEIRPFEADPYMLTKIDFAIDLYLGSHSKSKYVVAKIEEIEDDILMIYRLRNMIIHNAHSRNTLLHYYVLKCQTYCEVLLRDVIEMYLKTKHTLGETILSIQLRKLKMLEKLEKGNKDFFSM